MVIGILALQGAVTPHFRHVSALGAVPVQVRAAKDLENIDALILPGGESSTMLRLLDYQNLRAPLAEFLKTKPAWGICAGAILLARDVQNPAQFSFAALDIAVRRNAYGSQLDSFHADITGYPVAFIRAPKIVKTAENVQVLASHDGAPVWVQQGNIVATTFHPELSDHAPSPMHRHFFDVIVK